MLQAGYEGLRRALAGQNQSLLRASREFAMPLREMDRTDESYPLSCLAVALARRTLGDNHPEILGAPLYLGTDLIRQGCFAEAAELLADLWKTQRRISGDAARDTAYVRSTWSYAMLQMGRSSEAEANLRAALETFRQASDQPHTNPAWCMRQLVAVLAAEGGECYA